MLFAGWIVGRLADLGWDRSVVGTVAAMTIGSLIIYSFGVPWLAASSNLEFGVALEKGLFQFLVFDAIKLGLAAGVFPSAWWYVNHGRSDGPR
jgi:biotin transport system substrate-specific component